MLRLADRLPLAVGEKITLMAHLPPLATDPPQLFVWLKSPPLAPVIMMLLRVSVAVPVFLSVTALAALLVPTAWLENARLVGARVTADWSPVPVSVIVCGLPDALSVTVTVPVRVPVVVGVKVTLMVQFAPAAKLAPQALVWLKSPVDAMLLTLSVALPVLVRVTV
jgi:hypothetical protein